MHHKNIIITIIIIFSIVCLAHIAHAKPRQTSGKVKAAATPPPEREPPIKRGKRLSTSQVKSQWGEYNKVFAKKRVEHGHLLERLLHASKMESKDDKDKLVELQKEFYQRAYLPIFDRLIEARELLAKAGSRLTMSDPGAIQTVMSIWENFAFICDSCVRMSDAAIPMLRSNSTWMETAKWCAEFSKDYYKGPDLVMLERVWKDLDLDNVVVKVEVDAGWMEKMKETLFKNEL